MTDPEDAVELLPDEDVEEAVNRADEFTRPVPIEAPEADAVEQKRVVEGDDEDYPEQA
jgi:hypothetical protein